MDRDCILLCVTGFKLNETDRVYLNIRHHIKVLFNLFIIINDTRNLDVWLLCYMTILCMCMCELSHAKHYSENQTNNNKKKATPVATPGAPQCHAAATARGSHPLPFDAHEP